MQNILYILIFVLFSIQIGLFLYLRKINERIGLYFKKGGENLEITLRTIISRLDKYHENIKESESRIKELEIISKKTFQKYSIARYNPFSEGSGDQSFSLAMLDKEDNGYIITSHFGRDFNRVYIKPLVNGKSKYKLAEEEEKVLKQAL